ncbi:hypothetical protein B0I35DRAFT_381589 [Stachybotrys elegans]|uniref:LysM domain-containing protein n=1 Tax=Stachybotrys elegans TaxID=80388 RepID=A0A8K0SK90_9HYPO|nr:hypothetical protein B0I35DRAFT_381589 [Stachybotrys elegans]
MVSCRRLLGLAALVSFQHVAAVMMIYEDALPTSLPTACSEALLADVACDRLVRDLRPEFFYRPASLERICTSDCSEALSSWKSSVRSSCGDESIPADFDLPASPVVVPATLEHVFKFTCLRENDKFCGPVAALAAVFKDPGVTPFNYLTEVPDGAEEPSGCDACLAARLRMRAGSPYFDDPVVASESLYQSLTSSCSITGRPVTTTTIDFSTSQPSPTDTSCDGDEYTIQAGDDCYSISEAQGVGTAWMLADNDLGAYCGDFPTSGTICITNKCENVKVATNQTCVEIATAAGITETQLKAWNPVINPVCSNLNMMNGTMLCIEPPGPRLPPPEETDLPPVTPTTAAPKPTDAAQGSNERCGRWYEVEAGDYCNMVILKFAISLEDFLFLNSGINVNCTNLFAEESYCVQAVGDINTYPGRPGYVSFTLDPSATFTGVPFTNLPNGTATRGARGYTPAPLATGVRDDCVHYFLGEEYQFEAAELGYWNSNCELAARNYDADDDTFAAWNALGTNVTDPACSFEVGRRYCGSWNVQAPNSIIGTPPTSSTMSGGPPAPTHSGQPADCDEWHVVVEGDSCQSVADGAGISADQFFDWNPAVSKDCVTNFWVGQAYCVGIAGDGGPPTVTTTSSTRTEEQPKPTPPAPTHTGQPANCNKWDVVEEGDSCSSIASDNGISTDQFFDWNPAVSRDCVSNFWLGNAYCVGVSGSGGNPPTTTTRNPTPPAPTHTGQPANCNKWDVVVEGDSCGSIAADNGISTDQFFSWNPAVSRDCVNNFWVGQAYCVGLSSLRRMG